MNEFKKAREDYEATPIPQELEDRVRAGIRQGKANYRRRRWRKYAAGTAACLVVLAGALNLSPTVAAAAAEVPVLGGLFRVLTVRDFHGEEDGINYDISVPGVEAEGELAQRVNDVIQEKVNAHLAKAQQDWEDYKEAFFATGGTEEEWNGREMDVIIDYEVKSQTGEQVSFVVSFSEGWVSSYEERYYYNLDLAQNRELTLQDFLGEDWVTVCNAAIRQQIDENAQADGTTMFFAPDEGGFTTVDETTSFYVREDGAVVVCFPKYSIAAGAAGNLEFVVQTAGK